MRKKVALPYRFKKQNFKITDRLFNQVTNRRRNEIVNIIHPFRKKVNTKLANSLSKRRRHQNYIFVKRRGLSV